MWGQCLVVEGAAGPWREHWDSVLKSVADQECWSSHRYNEGNFNCYTFVLNFLQNLRYGNLSKAAVSRTNFCENFIVPRTTAAGKYISLYRKLNDLGCYIQRQNFHTIVPANVEMELTILACEPTVKFNSDEATDEFCFDHDSDVDKGHLKKRAVSNMQIAFGLTPLSAQALINNYPALKSVSLESIQCNINYFRDKGLSLDTLKKNPWLLTYKIGTIRSKLEILSTWNLGDVNVIYPLLRMKLNELKENSKIEETDNDNISTGKRIKYTSDKLKCDLTEACKVFGEHEFLYSMPFKKYSCIMEKLLEAKISPHHILKDVWVFQYGIKKIEVRLQVLKEVGVNPIKPWMLRSSPKIFETTLQRVLSRKEVLGESSVVEYLTQQLECDVETVEFLASKHPILLKKHVTKLNEVFDFLYAEGFTPQQVIQVPRIMFHSVETIKSRLTELREAGYNPSSLMTLCKSKREFAKIVEIAMKRKLRNIPYT
ncbi:hypothetical protein L9F63_019853 [Diploptera punctata]|uniref:MKRN2 opposite strand protein-like C-terminal domain-containing protein n=1 Tax=Diploptera punctata TaxID=6984 RepID=A0AAD8EDH2_DIPPU|nr:hypothetical protein L9F63_019853 [Diploptera punctata]